MDSRSAVELARMVAADQDGALARTQALSAGMTRSAWTHRLSHGWVPLLDGVAFVPEVSVELPGPRARGRAALLRAGEGSVLTLGSALRVLGIEGCPSGDPEHVLLPPTATRHQCAGIRFHWEVCPPSFQLEVGGLPLTSPVWSGFQALRHWDREHAVSVLDSALLRGRLSHVDLELLAVSPLPAARRAWIALADGKAESPLETRSRLFFGDHGLTGFEPQVWIDVPGIGRVRVDFKRGRVIVEADGREVHDEATSSARDRLRREALEAMGFIVVVVTWRDVVYNPSATVARILRAMGRASLADGGLAA